MLGQLHVGHDGAARRGSSSRTATAGSTRRRSGGTPASATATCCMHTLPMFHCNGWGMPYAVTGMGGSHVVLRKIDGEEILSRIERHGVTLLCGAPAVVAAILDAAETRAAEGRDVPGARHGAHRRGRCATALQGDRAGRDRARLGVHADLRADRDLTAAHHQPGPVRVGRARRGRALGAAQPGRRAGDRRADRRRRRGRGAGPVQPRLRRLLGAARRRRRRRSRAGGSTPATAATSTAPTS